MDVVPRLLLIGGAVSSDGVIIGNAGVDAVDRGVAAGIATPLDGVSALRRCVGAWCVRFVCMSGVA